MKETKKKILFLDHTPFVGGAQLSLIQHLEKINRGKFDVIIGCSRKAKELGLTEQYNNIGVKYYFISFGKLKSFSPAVLHRFIKSIFEIKKLIKREDINLVVSNTVRTTLVGSLAVWLSNIKIIWLIRDFTFPLMFFKFFSYFPKKIIFNSKATALYYKNYLKNHNKIIVVYVGRSFYEKARNVSNSAINKQKKEWGVDNGIIVIGYIGRLVKDKGPQILIKAIELLIKQGITGIKCIIAGTGKGQEDDNEIELKAMANNFNLENYIIFTGYKKNIAKIIMSLDALVLTSIKLESFPSVVIDAMMAKVPVIGTNIGGTPEIIKDYQTGLLIKPGDAGDLSEAIKKLINGKELREKIIKNAYNRVMKYHTADYTTLKTEKNVFINIIYFMDKILNNFQNFVKNKLEIRLKLINLSIFFSKYFKPKQNLDPDLDLIIILFNDNKGWIIEKICNEIAKKFSGSFKIIYDNKNLPDAKVYFLPQYTYLPKCIFYNPKILSRKIITFFTHREPLYSNNEFKKILNYSHLIVSMSSFYRNKFISLGLDEKKIKFILGGGADPNKFVFHQRNKGKVGLCSNYYERKNPELLIQIIQAMPNTNFLLLGRNWKNYKKFDQLVSFKNFEYVEDEYKYYSKYYKQMDVFLSLSENEGGPIPLIEAMMSNVVPVCSNTGFAADLIKHGGNGFLFNPDEYTLNEIKIYIEKAFEFNINIRKTVLDFTWDNFVEKINLLIYKLIKEYK